MKPTANPSKEAERERIAADLAAFQRRGGKIRVYGSRASAGEEALHRERLRRFQQVGATSNTPPARR